MEVYVVISREMGLISVRMNEEDAKKDKTQQIIREEMMGGRPSVWYEISEVR